MNYNKSLLSIAAALAIGSSGVYADYLPLADGTNHNEWMLFGVNNFVGGASSSTGDFAGGLLQVTDTLLDEVAVEHASGLFAVKALPGSTVPVTVAVPNLPSEETDPIRTIYVDYNDDGAVDFAVTYKSILEGQELQYRVGAVGANIYSITLSSANTYDTPNTDSTLAVSGTATSTTLLNGLDVDDNTAAIDYDFTDNPTSASDYTWADYYTADGASSLRLYKYDATLSTWEMFDTGNSVTANDFDTLEIARGYWGKLNSASTNVAGLVLGDGTTSATDYGNLGLADGWNLLSYNNSSFSQLRHASTGLLVTLDAPADTDVFTLWDSSGTHSVTITLDATTAVNNYLIAKLINFEVAKAKANGTLPKLFDLKAFVVDNATNQLALVSNKKFSIKDGNGDPVGLVTTLTGAAPYNFDDKLVTTTQNADVSAVGVTSKYGEYAMMMTPLVGGNSAANTLALAGGAEVNLVHSLADSTLQAAGTSVLVDIGNTTVDATATAITTAAATVLSYPIDIDSDSTTGDAAGHEVVLMASTQPFYVRDNTFALTFTKAIGAAIPTTSTLSIAGNDIVIDDVDTVADVLTAVNIAAVTAEGVQAVADHTDAANKVVFVANGTDADRTSSTFHILRKLGGDYLSLVKAPTSDTAKGAISGVYSLDKLAKKGIVNSSATVLTDGDAATGELLTGALTLDYSTYLTTGTLLTTAVGADVADSTTYYARVIDEINQHFTDENIDATASVSGVNGGNDFDATITVSGSGIMDAEITVSAPFTATTAAAATDDQGQLADTTADLTSDLKYNSVYTPNYVKDGMFYTLKEAGYSVKALVAGTTDLSTGNVTWESIDMTRPPSEWLDSQDYNLFDTDGQLGYWAYLESDATNPVSFTSASLPSLSYKHYFDGTTTNNIAITNINAIVAGIVGGEDDGKSARITASIGSGGLGVELTRGSVNSNTYTGSINSLDVSTSLNEVISVDIYAADGLGNKAPAAYALNLDNQKPVAPASATMNGSSLTITPSVSVDVAGYYVYEGIIPETTESGYLAKVAAANIATPQAICGTAVTTASTPTTLSIIAVDGTGSLFGGNVSDILTEPYMAIAKSRVVLSDNNNVEYDETVGGTLYDANCEVESSSTQNVYGMTLTSHTPNVEVKIAFDKANTVNGVDIQAVPNVIYVSDGAAGNVAEIRYANVYEGDSVFVMIGGVVYTATLTAPAVGAAGYVDTNPLSILGNVKTDVTF